MEEREQRRQDRRQNDGDAEHGQHLKQGDNEDVDHLHDDHAAQYTAEQAEGHGDGDREIGDDVDGIDVMQQPPPLVLDKAERVDEKEGAQRERQAGAEVGDRRAQAEQLDEHPAADVRRRPEGVRPHQPAVIFRQLVRALVEKGDQPLEEHLPARRRRLPFADDGQPQDERRQQDERHDDKAGDDALVDRQPAQVDDLARKNFIIQFGKNIFIFSSHPTTLSPNKIKNILLLSRKIFKQMIAGER